MSIFSRQTSGSVVCTSCGSLVGVRDEKCFNCGRRNPGMWGFSPLLRSLGHDLGFVSLVIWGCGILYVISLVLSRNQIGVGGGLFGILSPSVPSVFLLGASGAVPVFGYGRWWTLLSAGWLHGSLLHIVFNMMAMRNLAPPVADFYGAGRMVIIYTVASVCGFALSSVTGAYLPPLPILRGAPLTLGASAAICGLLGALLYYGRRTGSHLVHSHATQYVIYLGVMGILVPGIDNFAHAGGFAGGYLAAMVLDPLEPERIDHIIIALVCLVATLASIAASVLAGVPPILR